MDEGQSVETLIRLAFTFLPTILVAVIFLVMSFVDVQALAQQLQGNATSIVLPPPPPPPYVPPTSLTITSWRCRSGGAPEVLRLLAPLADVIRRAEPHTLAFQLLQSEKEPDSLLLVERFRSHADMLRPHRSSRAYVEFRRLLGRSGCSEDEATEWLSTAVGYANRHGGHRGQTRQGAGGSNQTRRSRHRLFV